MISSIIGYLLAGIGGLAALHFVCVLCGERFPGKKPDKWWESQAEIDCLNDEVSP